MESKIYLHLARGREGITFCAHLDPDKQNEYIVLLWVGILTGRAVPFISVLFAQNPSVLETLAPGHSGPDGH